MIDIKPWMKQYQKTVQSLFAARILFIGLQGSYARNEADAHSDIDVVLILDKVSLEDLKLYKQAIQNLPNSSQICGFVSGKQELANWIRSDLFQFYHDTIPYYGDLEKIIPALTDADIRSAVLLGACNLYHSCSHNFIHSGNLKTLKTLYKSAIFILQAKHYLESGEYIRSHTALADVLTDTDLDILQADGRIKNTDTSQISLEQYSEQMLRWTSALICEYRESPGKN